MSKTLASANLDGAEWALMTSVVRWMNELCACGVGAVESLGAGDRPFVKVGLELCVKVLWKN